MGVDLIGIALGVVFVLTLVWATPYLAKCWRERPMVMWDDKTKHWRAHSLQGRPWRSKRHGVR